jgi:hypothetical protein
MNDQPFEDLHRSACSDEATILECSDRIYQTKVAMGRMIAEKRKDMGLTQRGLGILLAPHGLSPYTVQNVERPSLKGHHSTQTIKTVYDVLLRFELRRFDTISDLPSSTSPHA